MPAEGGGISGELNGVYAVVREARGEVGRPNPRHLGERVVGEADEGTEVAAGAEEGDEGGGERRRRDRPRAAASRGECVGMQLAHQAGGRGGGGGVDWRQRGGGRRGRTPQVARPAPPPPPERTHRRARVPPRVHTTRTRRRRRRRRRGQARAAPNPRRRGSARRWRAAAPPSSALAARLQLRDESVGSPRGAAVPAAHDARERTRRRSAPWWAPRRPRGASDGSKPPYGAPVYQACIATASGGQLR